jgi:hypothetical protein
MCSLLKSFRYFYWLFCIYQTREDCCGLVCCVITKRILKKNLANHPGKLKFASRVRHSDSKEKEDRSQN